MLHHTDRRQYRYSLSDERCLLTRYEEIAAELRARMDAD
ncbi:hypothetical protein, partial [Frankia sp. CpI1-P]